MGCVEGFTNMEGGEEQLALPLTTSYPSLPPNTTTTSETSAAPRSPVVVRPAQPSDAGALAAANKKRDTSGSKVKLKILFEMFRYFSKIKKGLNQYRKIFLPDLRLSF